MAKINVVLVEPQIPQNTGNISRTCAVTGAALHIVKPCGFEITDKKLKRAGLDYWDSLEIYYYGSLEDFLLQHQHKKLYYFSTKAKKIYSECILEESCFLLFGREDKGLPEKLIFENMQNALTIPMREGQRSLNLSNTVAIAVYEQLRQHNFKF